MSLFTDSIGQALEMLAAAAAEPGWKKPWVLSFTADETGVFVEATDIEMTSADESAKPLLVLEPGGSPAAVRERFLLAWAGLPSLSDPHGRPVSAVYQDSLGTGWNEGGAAWSWQRWDEID